MALTIWWKKLRGQTAASEQPSEPESLEPDERDAKVFAELDRLGVDLTHARHTIYFLYFPTKTSARCV